MSEFSLLTTLRRVPKRRLEDALLLSGHIPPRMELLTKFDLIDQVVHLLNTLPVQDAADLWASIRR